MVVADSSAWVEYLRSTGSGACLGVRTLIETSDLLRTTEVVVMEVLVGARGDREYSDTSRLLGRFELLPMNGLDDFLHAVALYRACRRGGETIRKMNDCLVAAVAVRTGAELLHQDRDFDVLARHSALKTYLR